MSRTFSSDGRFYIEYIQRSSDSYMSSDTSYSWKVYWRETDREFASFGGSWDQSADREEKSGASDVSFSDDGRELVVAGFDGSTVRQALPPVTAEERREVQARIDAWNALLNAPAAASTVVGSGLAGRLFQRDIQLMRLTKVSPAVPGLGVESGDEVQLGVGDWKVTIPGGPNLRECDGLHLAVTRVPGEDKVRVTAIEIAPRRRDPDALALEEYKAFLHSGATATRLPLKKKVVVCGHKIKRLEPTGFEQILIDGTSFGVRDYRVEECNGLRFALRRMGSGQIYMYATRIAGPP
jgi:hypothetical protein